MRSLVVELLCLGVQRGALLDGSEASDLQGLACLRDGLNPWGLLAKRRLLLADNLAELVLGEVLGSQATNSLRLASTEHHGLGHDALRDLAHCLLLHDLHGLHGCLLLHHLHGLHGCLLLHHLHCLHGCLLLITFMAFMAAFFFITFIAFMAAFFFITFMAFMA